MLSSSGILNALHPTIGTRASLPALARFKISQCIHWRGVSRLRSSFNDQQFSDGEMFAYSMLCLLNCSAFHLSSNVQTKVCKKGTEVLEFNGSMIKVSRGAKIIRAL